MNHRIARERQILDTLHKHTGQYLTTLQIVNEVYQVVSMEEIVQFNETHHNIQVMIY